MEKFKKFEIKKNFRITGGDTGMGLEAFVQTCWSNTDGTETGQDMYSYQSGRLAYLA